MLGLGREEGVAGLERREMRESTLKRLDEEEMELCEREIERLQAELAAEEQASAEWLEIDGDRAALVS